MGKILEVKNLTIHIKTHKGVVQAVRGVDFYLNEQETLAVVGESGSGKSITMKGVMGILPKNGKVVDGTVMFQGNDLTKYTERQMQQVRGSRDRHDLPGSNDLPEPYHEGWKTDRGNAQGALQGDEQGRPQGKSH